jgi:hypothetical protein
MPKAVGMPDFVDALLHQALEEQIVRRRKPVEFLP